MPGTGPKTPYFPRVSFVPSRPPNGFLTLGIPKRRSGQQAKQGSSKAGQDIRTHTLTEWRLEPPPETAPPNGRGNTASGLVADYIVAIDVIRVRFLVDAQGFWTLIERQQWKTKMSICEFEWFR